MSLHPTGDTTPSDPLLESILTPQPTSPWSTPTLLDESIFTPSMSELYVNTLEDFSATDIILTDDIHDDHLAQTSLLDHNNASSQLDTMSKSGLKYDSLLSDDEGDHDAQEIASIIHDSDTKLVNNDTNPTSIEQLIRPPVAPSLGVIKAAVQTLGTVARPIASKSRKTVRWSTALVAERDFSSEDPPAKSSRYAGQPGHLPPDTYIGIPMDMGSRGTYEPSIKVHVLRTSTSKEHFDDKVKMITSAVPTSTVSSNKGFDSDTCDVGVYDLTASATLASRTLKRWDKLMHKLFITEQKGSITQSSDTFPDNASPSILLPAGGNNDSSSLLFQTSTPPHSSETIVPNSTQNLVIPLSSHDHERQLLAFQEKQQNVITGGGPWGCGVGIGFYRLLSTINTQDQSHYDDSVYNPSYVIRTPPTAPLETFPLHRIRPTRDTFFFNSSYFPSIPPHPVVPPSSTQMPLTTQSPSPPMSTTSTSTSTQIPLSPQDEERCIITYYPYKASYNQQVLLSTKPRGHCETSVAIIEQRRIQQSQYNPTSIYNLNEQIIDMVNSNYSKTPYKEFLGLNSYQFNNNTPSNADMDDSPVQIKLTDLSIPYLVREVLKMRMSSALSLFRKYYYDGITINTMIDLFIFDTLTSNPLQYITTPVPLKTELVLIEKQLLENIALKKDVLKTSSSLSGSSEMAQNSVITNHGSTILPTKTSAANYIESLHILSALSPAQQALKYALSGPTASGGDSLFTASALFDNDTPFSASGVDYAVLSLDGFDDSDAGSMFLNGGSPWEDDMPTQGFDYSMPFMGRLNYESFSMFDLSANDLDTEAQLAALTPKVTPMSTPRMTPQSSLGALGSSSTPSQPLNNTSMNDGILPPNGGFPTNNQPLLPPPHQPQTQMIPPNSLPPPHQQQPPPHQQQPPPHQQQPPPHQQQPPPHQQQPPPHQQPPQYPPQHQPQLQAPPRPAPIPQHQPVISAPPRPTHPQQPHPQQYPPQQHPHQHQQRYPPQQHPHQQQQQYPPQHHQQPQPPFNRTSSEPGGPQKRYIQHDEQYQNRPPPSPGYMRK